MKLLTDTDVEEALRTLPGWRRDGNRIVRTVKAPSFLAGIELVTRIAHICEARDHHPDVDIRYRDITFAFTTHDSGGITRRDVELAQAVDILLEGL